ncbi:DUF4886 domain-containing protein [Desertivirga xinjiangensis]|uniref:DUF4886 domain-containing protein n=1 Tax=Desertivirga xinjiangensis TaxID=539206 RepID=UPI00210D4629|nr:DUF4886 domain-containing protein [Pedobacter xinjiangensis]
MKLTKIKLVLLLAVFLSTALACSKKANTDESVKTNPEPPAKPNPEDPSTGKKNIKLFLIGNSFSQNATTFLPALAAENRHSLTIGRAELSSFSLQLHWEAVVKNLADANDVNGKPYKGKSLKELLATNSWDIISIQQVSGMSGKEGTYQPYLGNLIEFIKRHQPNAEIVLHQTWAYRSDATVFTQIYGGNARTEQEMWEKSRAAYHLYAEQFGLRIIPTGDAFWLVSSNSRWKYNKDLEFNYSQPVYPQLPDQSNSLHIGYYWNAGTFGFDSHHANTAGCFLGSLTFYNFLFKESPSTPGYTPAGIDSEFASFLKYVAQTAVDALNN